MRSRVTHIRLPEAEYKYIDESIKDGYFTSRSDFVRSAIRLQIHETSKRKLEDMMRDNKSKRTHNEILKTAKKSRKEVYKEIWG